MKDNEINKNNVKKKISKCQKIRFLVIRLHVKNIQGTLITLLLKDEMKRTL